ncbi:alpha/beta hydrolase family protein [Desulfosporosinus metallidurans]|uniref:alpha/beta hydrolase family protein n=1 Tax=Desulfosporosinus metallidurans TaxID=1888891 RepID=UPI0014801B67|nr:hypothetical protein [Desulfosporosinus metallidurans]
MIFVLLLTLSFSGVACGADIVGPSQPTSGPGGSNYTYSSVMSQTIGSGVNKYIIYEPSPKATVTLPVLAFIHGYSLNPTPDNNQDFIDHLVKKGNIVIWPYYENMFTDPNNYDVNAGNAIKAAMNYIIANPSTHAQPKYDPSGNMDFGILGHSAGGTTTANIASRYSTWSLPKPKAIMTMNAGRNLDGSDDGVPYRDYSQIANDTYMLTLVSSEDTTVEDIPSRYIWNNSTQISSSLRDWILIKSDTHGSPDTNDISSVHSDVNNQVLDAIDYYGAWKWATALFNYASPSSVQTVTIVWTTPQTSVFGVVERRTGRERACYI